MVERRQQRLPYRIPTHTTDVWTCPVCNASYWPPKEWEPEVAVTVMQTARSIHGRRHAQERIDKAEGLI
jgi:uncharacterized protein with PIN domain